MHPSLLILLVSLIYILGFGVLSFMRRQGLSIRSPRPGAPMTGPVDLTTEQVRELVSDAVVGRGNARGVVVDATRLLSRLEVLP